MNKTIILTLLSLAMLSTNVSAGIMDVGKNASEFPNGVSIIVQVSGLKSDSYKVIIKDGKLKVSSENIINADGDKESFYYLTHLPDDINGENIIYSVDVDGLLSIGFKWYESETFFLD